MTILSDFEQLLPTLSRGEKAQFLKWVVQDLGSRQSMQGLKFLEESGVL